MKRQGGFTLIELVVVIVILGILAVTAAPRFLNLQSDARESALQGLKGAIDGASGIVFGKAAIEGVETKTTADKVTVENVKINYGYPQALAGGLDNAVNGLTQDWALVNEGTDPETLVATFVSGDLKPGFDTKANTVDKVQASECYVTYTEATSSAVATTIVTDSGC
ncbi:type II secretion system protein [Vibrio parahaemolyticus]|uniref:type II secretion system protein n=1 Tax=Vibrio parahaemolyticus TaxID=670 RepID=UPI00073F84DB|nr:type II secretion system protein [Vibrio parahaemolyticus]KAB5598092.1 prepilin-type N-terminal cleavage/methylation domain-containing protein [Vibrio parahaemolyticus]KUH60343.1 MSHA biogenesis protein MshA [Vibrio parahaemolyticus]MDF4676753.1 type II secretion system protein [Vibrio parahaemolyticus]MDF4701071.1 type II secretion system protein [Vibrio parahaemolyticus]TOG91449.1 MSHA biogenesis protein MshA [Vibrio parahaemolyticus]